MLVAERHENERLRQIIKEMQRHRFGRRAETLPEDQLLFALEEADQVVAAAEAGSEEAAPAERAVHAARRRVNRGSLPAHLSRIMRWSISTITPAPAAAAHCTGSART